MSDPIQFPIQLAPTLSDLQRRKIADTLTNLGLRLNRRFTPSETAAHRITVNGDELAWEVEGKMHPTLGTDLTKVVEILSFAHLKEDPQFPDRPILTQYDPQDLFLERIFEDMRKALSLERPPHNAHPTVILQITHDVDNPQLRTAYQMARAAVLRLKGDKAQSAPLWAAAQSAVLRRPDPFWCFETICQLARQYGFKSTYFTFASYPGQHPRDPRYNSETPRYETALRTLAQDGHEIGLHSGIRYNDFAKPRSFLPTDPIKSHRAHYWSAPRNALEAWFDSMASAGITADASLSPQCCGSAMGSAYPLWFTTQSGRTLLLYPSQFMDTYQMQENAQGAILDALTPHVGAAIPPVLNLNWHVRVFSGIGPWKGYPESFTNLLETIIAKYDTRPMTVFQSTTFYKGQLNAYHFTP
ncbi:polysaccharide deacetylase family protein [Cochlodiniinecator piscidefendens]|uniref:hypothetical protein n=1 Tax=Cochlodiniinecator piscidefendens TaxID=2715756 RepID=UPI001408990D|nr:hypothetical protein [Cochlodiniinecator piscidefendens]